MHDNDNIDRYDAKWHRRVEHTLFGFMGDEDGVWVDGLLQSLADMKRLEVIFVRVGLPLLIVITAAVVAMVVRDASFAHSLGSFLRGLSGR